MKSIFITGTSSGIGFALANKYLDEGWRVYGVSRKRSTIEHPNFSSLAFDISDFEHYTFFDTLFHSITHLDLIVLNAGILGDIKDLRESSLDDLKEVMEINLWANKAMIDYFIRSNFSIGQIVAISSGAAVNGSRGWSGYSLSKAALNMLIKLYAQEMPKTHLSALAPGLITTPMLNYIIDEIDDERFPSISRLKESDKRTPQEAAEMLFNTFHRLLKYESGSFVDIRSI